jgi:hypothetical protein
MKNATVVVVLPVGKARKARAVPYQEKGHRIPNQNLMAPRWKQKNERENSGEKKRGPS